MASPDSKLIRVPIGHAIVKVGEDVIRTGTLDDIQIPPKTMWTVILDTASESLRSVDQSFDLGSQPRAKPNRTLRQIALSRVNVPSSSKHDEHAVGLPIRIWENVRAPQVPPKSEKVAPKKLSKFAQILGNQPQPYIQTIHAQITERTLPTIPAGVFALPALTATIMTLTKCSPLLKFSGTPARTPVLLSTRCSLQNSANILSHQSTTPTDVIPEFASKPMPASHFLIPCLKLAVSASWSLALWSPMGE